MDLHKKSNVKIYNIQAKCIFNKGILKLVQKNPHTTQYFCDIENIDVCSNTCSKKPGFIYKRKFRGPLHQKNILSKLNLQSNYKKDKLPETHDDIKNGFTFYNRKQLPVSTVHWGQLKLFLSTLNFLINYCPKEKDVNILYVGSAEGHNIPLLVEMFPNTDWYLVDPRDVFDKRLYNMKRVKMIKNAYFTDKLAMKMKKRLKKKYFLFISDIREFKGKDKDENDIDVDMKLQYNWYKILKPEYSQLKFRIPYNKKKYDYLDGKIFFQEYAPVSSTETRLVVKKNAKNKIYSLKEYEGKCFYFNRIIRPSYYKHSYNHIDIMDHCYDCSKMFYLIDKYNLIYPYFFKKLSMKNTIELIITNFHVSNVLEKETQKVLSNIK